MTYLVKPLSIYPCLTRQGGKLLTTPEQFHDELIQQTAHIKQTFNCVPYYLFTDVTEGRVYGREELKMLSGIIEIIKQHNVEYNFLLDGEYEDISILKDIDNIIYTDFLVLSSYANGILDDEQPINESWNNTSPKGLWTMGKPDRPHRIVLLSKLWENNLLDKIEWSLYVNDTTKKIIHEQLLPHYDIEKLEKFISECTRTLDFKATIMGEVQCNGYPFDVNLYKNTSFSIITESDFGISTDTEFKYMPKLTEKTYRTIINKHPYLIAWYPGMIEKIKSKGYRTFEEYTVDPKYNSHPNLNVRLAKLAKIINFFHAFIHKNPQTVEKVNNDVEYNFQLFNQKASLEIQKLSRIFRLPQRVDANITPIKLARYFFPSSRELFAPNLIV